MQPKFRLPKPDQRTSIFGRTGSGKTVFATWLLSHAAFTEQPFIIVDYKRDRLLALVPAIEIGLTERLPRKPGLYIVHPKPDDIEEMEAFLWRVWEQEKIGIYFDEMYMLPDKGAMRAILTQGRSKHIPAICLSQRPVWISRFVLSEADFISVFRLQHPKDRAAVDGFTGDRVANIPFSYPEYHSVWYDVAKGTNFHMLPVASEEDILDRIEDRLKPKRKVS